MFELFTYGCTLTFLAGVLQMIKAPVKGAR
jgi:hypothetical protein